MNKLNLKSRIITDTLIVFIIFLVFAVSFLPSAIVPINSINSEGAIYNGNRANKNVSIMINVYENKDVVESMIETFDYYGIKATFFVGGCWADDNGQTLVKIVESGHEIANHGYFHKDHKKLTYEKNKEEISLTSKIIKALCGVEPTLFAPPSGSYSDNTLVACAELNYKLIMWSKDTIDWRDDDKAILFKRATNNPQNGDLILMHPKVHTLEILPKIIEFYLQSGFNLVTVSENIK